MTVAHLSLGSKVVSDNSPRVVNCPWCHLSPPKNRFFFVSDTQWQFENCELPIATRSSREHALGLFKAQPTGSGRDPG